jgi:hypothetical protein
MQFYLPHHHYDPRINVNINTGIRGEMGIPVPVLGVEY